MTLYLVRHADAGDRSEWRQPDDLRPLTARGERQAAALAGFLAERRVEAVLSSRFARCVQTVEPLAARLGLTVEEHPALAEEATEQAVVDLLEAMAGTDAVLCTHGNIVPVALGHLRRAGARFADRPYDWKKGSVWVLESDDGRGFTGARYVPPPG